MLDKFLGANIALLLFFLVISIRIAAKLINRKVFGTNIYDFNLEKIWGRREKEERKKINKYLAYNKRSRESNWWIDKLLNPENECKSKIRITNLLLPFNYLSFWIFQRETHFIQREFSSTWKIHQRART